MKIEISFNPETLEVETLLTSEKTYRQRNKGKNILAFPEEYVVIDTETTGFDPEYNEIIEVCAIKIKDGKEVDRFNSLVKPEEEIDGFVTNLTGITNDMLKNASLPDTVISNFMKFIGSNILVAHNAHFDINFLYDYTERHLSEILRNDFICTMRLAKRVFPEYKNYKLKTICEKLNLELPTHRSVNDAIAAWNVYKCCKNHIEKKMTVDQFIESTRKRKLSFNASDIKPNSDSFDTNHPVYRKTFVFTGALSKMVRKEAMQLVVDLGGKCSSGVTKTTNYLVMGVQDYSRFADGYKSNKTKKAEELILNDHDILIISENNFYDLVLEKDSI